jgi:hypothetical protein
VIYSLVPNMPAVLGGQPLPANLIASENDTWVTPPQSKSAADLPKETEGANINIENKQLTQFSGNKRGSRQLKEVQVFDPETLAAMNIQKWIRTYVVATEYKKTVEKFRRNCKLAAEEILKTERAYVRDLEVIIKVSLKYAHKQQNINILREKQQKTKY